MDSAIPLFAIGLVGSLVMFAGDMLLYFTPGAYDMDGTLRPYARIMRDLPEGRVRAGGVLGPSPRSSMSSGSRGCRCSRKATSPGWPG